MSVIFNNIFKNFFRLYVEVVTGPVPHSPLGVYILAHMTQLPTCQSPHSFVWGFPWPAACALPAGAAGSPQLTMDGGWCINTPAPSFELERIFSSDFQSFPCRIRLQLPIVITAFPASLLSCLPGLISPHQSAIGIPFPIETSYLHLNPCLRVCY